MKRIIASALVATAAFAGAASAMTEGPSVSELHTIQNYAPTADLSGLTAADADHLVAIIQSSDNEGEKRFNVRTFLK
ncbi:hypothetical protein [Pacificoceanicola onchidii]|uniref:hypothetical protein n=1 Tax=Pacificoceanicola onchidii TaxID=2562685 RepID=UPI0010A598AB|nr:hypothetical protein [Pacificoceanicola onchidii]